MRLWRTFPLDRSAPADGPGGPLWFPREQQGHGRHDNPESYACIYVSEQAVSAVAERMAAFRGSGRLTASMLTQLGRPLALAEISLPDEAVVIDLDDPDVLAKWRLHPSWIAGHDRDLTQSIAHDLYFQAGAMALRWWSTLEASWMNWTIFEHGAEGMSVVEVSELRIDDPVLREAAAFLGLAP